MVELFAIIFVTSGIMAYFAMLIHSLFIENHDMIYSKESDENYSFSVNRSFFIFLGGTIIAFLLEFTLVHQLKAYSYTNLPLTIYDIPIIIPMGWVITFYAISYLSADIIRRHYSSPDHLDNRHGSLVLLLTFVIALIFGFTMEVLARISDFWIFYFESPEFVGVPIIVTLAWGLSVAAFTLGLLIYEFVRIKYSKQKSWFFVIITFTLLILVHTLNVLIAYVLMSFTS